MLRVQLLSPTAIVPTCAHPGEDLGYDIYADEEVILYPGKRTVVSTGISAVFQPEVPEFLRNMTDGPIYPETAYGLLFRDRSSMAAKGISLSAGVIDAGYRGELKVILTLESNTDQKVLVPLCVDEGDISTHDSGYVAGYRIRKGDKIAQMIPIPVLTEEGLQVVDILPPSRRGFGGFGSTGANKAEEVRVV